jgi:hypothetical protein
MFPNILQIAVNVHPLFFFGYLTIAVDTTSCKSGFYETGRVVWNYLHVTMVSHHRLPQG